MTARQSHERRILEVLRESAIPMDVENVRVRSGLKNWESTKAILLEMVLKGVIGAQKTTKSWVFWVNAPSPLVRSGKGRRREIIAV